MINQKIRNKKRCSFRSRDDRHSVKNEHGQGSVNLTDDSVIRNFSIAALSTGRRLEAFTRREGTQNFGNIVVGEFAVPDILNVRLVECGETSAKGLTFARLRKRENAV